METFIKNRQEFQRTLTRSKISFLDMARKSGGLTLWAAITIVPIGIIFHLFYLWGWVNGYNSYRDIPVTKEVPVYIINVNRTLPATGVLPITNTH